MKRSCIVFFPRIPDRYVSQLLHKLVTVLISLFVRVLEYPVMSTLVHFGRQYLANDRLCCYESYTNLLVI